MQTNSIPPLRLIPLELKHLPSSLSFKNPQPKYWFGDRLQTIKGWGICIGLKNCKALNAWLYYIDLDEISHPQPFFEADIINKHKQ